MKKRRSQIYLKIFIIIAIFGVAVSAQKKADDVASGQWNLIEINGKKTVGSKAFIEFDENEMKITGNAGCNRMFGSYERDGKNIKISGIGTTKKFCAETGLMKTEADFTAALGKTTNFAVQNGMLNSFAGNRLLLKFTRTGAGNSASSSPIKLEDKKWILVTVKNEQISATQAFLVFDEAERRVGGDGGCNSFGGNYTARGAKIKFAKIVSTLRACGDNKIMKTERDFMNGLRAADSFSIKNEKLYFYKGKKLLLTLLAAK